MSYEIEILISRLMVIMSLWFFSLSFQTSMAESSLILIELTLIIIMMITYLNAKLTHSAQDNFLNKYLNEILFVLFIGFALFFPHIVIFMPVILVEARLDRVSHVLLTIPLIIYSAIVLENYPLFIALIILSMILSWFYRVLISRHQFERESYLQIDQLRNFNQEIQKEQDLLLSLQDQRIETSRNHERKRIVSEIHDILGHQISSSVIQIAALQYAAENSELKEQLKAVETVLQEGMDNIRSVIHKEHEDALDLKLELENMINDFVKCPIHFQYNLETRPSSQTAHAISNSVREALTNINKHSNASHVDIHLQELSDSWQLLIRDNGTLEAKSDQVAGIGLLNMEERILRLKGTFHVSQENGFRIFIIIPKGANTYENPRY